MSEAPAWLADALLAELIRQSEDETRRGMSMMVEDLCDGIVLVDGGIDLPALAQGLWDAFPPAVLIIPDTELDGQMPLPTMILRGEAGPELTDLPAGRVIPSRTSDPDTSRAAEPPRMKANSQRALLLDAFVEWEGWHRGDGLTDEEAMEIAVGVSPLSEYSKRCSELREAGYIEPTGERREGSSGHQRIVSRITDKGRAWIRDNT